MILYDPNMLNTGNWLSLFFCLTFDNTIANVIANVNIQLIYDDTVMRIIKLKIFPVPVHLHSGYGKLIFVIISPFVLQYLRTLYIVWSLVRRRVTRRLTRFQTMHNVFKYTKTFQNGCGYVAVNFSIYLCSVQYCLFFHKVQMTSHLNSNKR